MKLLMILCFFTILNEGSSLVDSYTTEFKNKLQEEIVVSFPKRINTLPIRELFNITKVQKNFEEWKTINSGYYVYVCLTNNYGNPNTLVMIENNKPIHKLEIPEENKKPDNIFTYERLDRVEKNTQSIDSSFIPFSPNPHANYLHDNRFERVINTFPQRTKDKTLSIEIRFDSEYKYITVLKKGKYSNRLDIPDVNIYSYGLLLLPNDIQYTKKVTQKILQKYEQAWKCTGQKLHSKSGKNNTNLTLLEKAVGKEKLECLEKYLVWDENDRKMSE